MLRGLFILFGFLLLQKMKGVIVLLVIAFSFSVASTDPCKKRCARGIKEGDQVTLPCCENVEVYQCGRGVLWKVFMVLLILFLLLLLLGCIKGLMGLCCPFVSIWGLGVMTDQQQPLLCCYETQLAGHPIICDCDDKLPYKSHAKAHTIHMYSRTAEFCLNLIFFLAYPIVLCCKCCKFHKKDDNKGLCIPECDPEKCYGSQLEEEDVKFVLEQLQRSRDSFKRCMCDAAEQTPLLSDRSVNWDAANPALESDRERALRSKLSQVAQCAIEEDEYVPTHSDLSSNDVDQYELLEQKQMLQHLMRQ